MLMKVWCQRDKFTLFYNQRDGRWSDLVKIRKFGLFWELWRHHLMSMHWNFTNRLSMEQDRHDKRFGKKCSMMHHSKQKSMDQSVITWQMATYGQNRSGPKNFDDVINWRHEVKTFPNFLAMLLWAMCQICDNIMSIRWAKVKIRHQARFRHSTPKLLRKIRVFGQKYSTLASNPPSPSFQCWPMRFLAWISLFGMCINIERGGEGVEIGLTYNSWCLKSVGDILMNRCLPGSFLNKFWRWVSEMRNIQRKVWGLYKWFFLLPRYNTSVKHPNGEYIQRIRMKIPSLEWPNL